jgi:hypothetical protein
LLYLEEGLVEPKGSCEAHTDIVTLDIVVDMLRTLWLREKLREICLPFQDLADNLLFKPFDSLPVFPEASFGVRTRHLIDP